MACTEYWEERSMFLIFSESTGGLLEAETWKLRIWRSLFTYDYDSLCCGGSFQAKKKKKGEEPVVGPQWTKELGLADSSCLPNLFVDS